MDNSALEILSSFATCSNLLQKKAYDWSKLLVLNPATILPSALLGLTNAMITYSDNLFGNTQNLVISLATLIDNLSKSTVEGSITWNSILEGATNKLKAYFPKIQLKQLVKTPESKEQIKNNVGLLQQAEKTVPKIIEVIDYLLSKEVLDVFKKEGETGLTKVWNFFSLKEVDKLNHLCETIKNQSKEYLDNIGKLKEQLKQAYQLIEVNTSKETNQEVEQYLSDKPKEEVKK
jgi:hypothetical protein